MTLALTSTCVGGRRAFTAQQAVTPALSRNHAHVRHEAQRAGMYHSDCGIGGQRWGLTRREVQVLEAVIEHGRAKVAAAALGLSVKTIECHMNACKEKSGHRFFLQLVAAYAAEKALAGGAAA